MTRDLTTITKPFGLLDEETKAHLLAAEVLAKVPPETEERCAKCGHPRSNHPYRHPFVSMGDTR